MKILFVQKEGGIFGAESYQLKIIPALISRGFEIDFLRLYTDYQGGKGGRFIDILRSHGVKTYEINIGRVINPLNLIRINRIIRQGKYDLVHTHLIHADLHLALTRIFLNPSLRIVSTKHGYDNAFTARHGFDPARQTLTPYFLLSKFSERFMIRSFTISRAIRNFFLKTGLSSEKKMSMIHYGFDFEASAQNWIAKEYRLFEKQLIIAGRLVRFKGHRFVLEALPAILKKYPEAGLVIAGSGDMEGELKALAHSLGIAARVAFIGYTSDVPRWMFNSDVVIVPSISEAFGVVLLEAFNGCKPVVAFDVPACNELIRNGETGFLVEPYNTAKLGDTIMAILDDPERGKSVGLAAQAVLRSYFNLNRMVEETIQFYKSI